MEAQSTEARQTLAEAAARPEQLVRLTLTGAGIGAEKIVARPVHLREGAHVQVTRFADEQATSENCPATQWPARLERLLALPFTHIHLSATEGEWHGRRTRKGRLLLSRGKGNTRAPTPAASHDRAKNLPLPGGQPDALLQAIDIQDRDGRLKASRRDKFRQINHFLGIVRDALGGEAPTGPLRVVDAGCGNAYLTFALFHFLHNLRGWPVELTGIDRNERSIAHCEALRERLGWREGLRFEASAIDTFAPAGEVDIMLGLHACDTATDEALALAVHAGARRIFCAPCCQHELRGQIPTHAHRPVLRYGILKQRVAEILTDAARAHLLRLHGYSVDVLEFIDSRHTPKNLLIRAHLTRHPPEPALFEEYRELKAQWGITPALERLLGERPHGGLAS
jgi:SAM-dependent methyltransferase